MGAGVFAARLDHGHLLPVCRTAGNIAFDGPFCRGHIAPDKGGVGPLNAVFLELSGKALVCGVVFGGYDKTAGVLIYPVNDPGPHNITNAGQGRSTMGDKRIDQRAAGITRCGMNDQSCRLVDDNKVVVLKDDIERDVLGLWQGGRRRRQGDRYLEALFDPPRRVDYRLAAEGHLTLFNEPFDACAAEVCKDLCKGLVKAQAVSRLIQRRITHFILLGHAFAMTDLNSSENPNSPDRKISNVPLPLKIAVYGMGLALAVMALLVASRFMDRRAENRVASDTQGVPWVIDLGAADLDMPTVGDVKSAVLDGRILTIVIDGPAGHDQVILIDTRKGEVIGMVRPRMP